MSAVVQTCACTVCERWRCPVCLTWSCPPDGVNGVDRALGVGVGRAALMSLIDQYCEHGEAERSLADQSRPVAGSADSIEGSAA